MAPASGSGRSGRTTSSPHDFGEDRTHEARKVRMLCVVDEITRECLAIRVDRKLGSAQVLETLAELMLERGVPEHIRSDNGSDSVAQAVQDWIAAVGSRMACIKPNSPGDRSQGGYVERFNSKLRNELPNREIFSLREAQSLIEAGRQHCIAIRPHSAPRWTPPAPAVRLPKPQIRPATTLAHYVPPNYH